jgi:hypothetical protein
MIMPLQRRSQPQVLNCWRRPAPIATSCHEQVRLGASEELLMQAIFGSPATRLGRVTIITGMDLSPAALGPVPREALA